MSLRNYLIYGPSFIGNQPICYVDLHLRTLTLYARRLWQREGGILRWETGLATLRKLRLGQGRKGHSKVSDERARVVREKSKIRKRMDDILALFDKVEEILIRTGQRLVSNFFGIAMSRDRQLPQLCVYNAGKNNTAFPSNLLLFLEVSSVTKIANMSLSTNMDGGQMLILQYVY